MNEFQESEGIDIPRLCSICRSDQIYFKRLIMHADYGLCLHYCQECFYEYGGKDEDYHGLTARKYESG
jgi:hypothetical protein